MLDHLPQPTTPQAYRWWFRQPHLADVRPRRYGMAVLHGERWLIVTIASFTRSLLLPAYLLRQLGQRHLLLAGTFFPVSLPCCASGSPVVPVALQPNQAMSALNIPLSVMLTDILACRLILDLRERGSGGSTQHITPSGHSHSGAGTRRMGTKAGTAIRTPMPDIKSHMSSGGAITQMDFNHELTTFHDGHGRQVVVRNGDHGDSSSEVDVKAMPLGV